MALLTRRLREATWLPVAIIVSSVLLLYALAGHHEQITRHEAVNVAVTKQDQLTKRFAAKLVLESELEKADPDGGHNNGPDVYLWAVAISGDCLVPGESGPPPTWSVVLVKDERPARLYGVICGGPDNWPPFFDQLVDRS